MNYLKDPFKALADVRNLTLCAVLIALAVLTSFLNFYLFANMVKVSFSFLFIALIGMRFGPLLAGFAGAVTDVIQYLYKPVGPFQPLLTMTALLTGIIYGVLLYKDRFAAWRVIVAHLTVRVIVDTLMNTYFIAILYGKVFREFLVTRAVKNAVSFPLELILLFLIINVYRKINQQIPS